MPQNPGYPSRYAALFSIVRYEWRAEFIMKTFRRIVKFCFVALAFGAIAVGIWILIFGAGEMTPTSSRNCVYAFYIVPAQVAGAAAAVLAAFVLAINRTWDYLRIDFIIGTLVLIGGISLLAISQILSMGLPRSCYIGF